MEPKRCVYTVDNQPCGRIFKKRGEPSDFCAQHRNRLPQRKCYYITKYGEPCGVIFHQRRGREPSDRCSYHRKFEREFAVCQTEDCNAYTKSLTGHCKKHAKYPRKKKSKSDSSSGST